MICFIVLFENNIETESTEIISTVEISNMHLFLASFLINRWEKKKQNNNEVNSIRSVNVMVFWGDPIELLELKEEDEKIRSSTRWTSIHYLFNLLDRCLFDHLRKESGGRLDMSPRN